MNSREKCVRMPNTAAIVNPNGTLFWVKFRYAQHLLDAGDHVMVCEKPLTVKPLDDSEFKDDLRRCSGRIVTGIAKMPFNGGHSSTSGYRVKPPRPDFDYWTYLNHEEDTGWADVKKDKAQRRIAKYMKERK